MANNNTSANVGFDDKLWGTADKLRGHMDPSEYKHVLLGLIFLKYISDSFEKRREELKAELKNPESFIYTNDPDKMKSYLEDRDEYLAENESAIDVLGDAQVAVIARKVLDVVRKNTSIDWTEKKSVRANLRMMVKRVLKHYGYPPDKQDRAMQLAIQQAELSTHDIAEE